MGALLITRAACMNSMEPEIPCTKSATGIMLQSADNRCLEVEQAIAKKSTTISHLISDVGFSATCIPLPQLRNLKDLEIAKRYMTILSDTLRTPELSKQALIDDLSNVTLLEALVDTLRVADALAIEPLFQASLDQLSDRIQAQIFVILPLQHWADVFRQLPETLCFRLAKNLIGYGQAGRFFCSLDAMFKQNQSKYQRFGLTGTACTYTKAEEDKLHECLNYNMTLDKALLLMAYYRASEHNEKIRLCPHSQFNITYKELDSEPLKKLIEPYIEVSEDECSVCCFSFDGLSINQKCLLESIKKSIEEYRTFNVCPHGFVPSQNINFIEVCASIPDPKLKAAMKRHFRIGNFSLCLPNCLMTAVPKGAEELSMALYNCAIKKEFLHICPHHRFKAVYDQSRPEQQSLFNSFLKIDSGKCQPSCAALPVHGAARAPGKPAATMITHRYIPTPLRWLAIGSGLIIGAYLASVALKNILPQINKKDA